MLDIARVVPWQKEVLQQRLAGTLVQHCLSVPAGEKSSVAHLERQKEAVVDRQAVLHLALLFESEVRRHLPTPPPPVGSIGARAVPCCRKGWCCVKKQNRGNRPKGRKRNTRRESRFG